jgi:hypothetical protein
MLLALILLIVGSILVAALSSYVIADFRALPAIRERTDQAEALKGATRMAINLQRDSGPTACVNASTIYQVNGMTITTTCTEGAAEMTGGSRFGIVSTSTKSDTAHIIGSGSSTLKKRISSPMFLNSGRLSPLTSDIMPNSQVWLSTQTSVASPVARYSLPAGGAAFPCNNAANGPAFAASDQYAVDAISGVTHALFCQSASWWSTVGDVDVNGVRNYPALPPMPTYDRTGTPTTYTSKCMIFYPGRYTGTTALVLNGGSNSTPANNISFYFASGIYYFERPIQILGGAKVVMGSGPAGSSGCVPDAVARSRISTPDVNGRGAMFIFGSNASLDVSGANTSVLFNQRVSTTLSPSSEGMSIRTVSTGVATPNIEIPQDQVQLPDGTMVNVTAYQPRLTATSPIRPYLASTLGHDGKAVAIRTDNNVKVIVPGYVITPHARFFMNGSGTTPTVKFAGGIVASEFQFTHTSTMAVGGWAMGAVPNVGQREFSIQSTLVDGSRTLVSRATLELDISGQYAVSQWAVNV